MCKIPPIKTKKIINFLLKNGWVKRHQKGSHIAFVKEGYARPIIILDYRETPSYITNQIIKM